jgi:hypothetical protein
MRPLLLIMTAMVSTMALTPAIAQGQKCSFDENELKGDLLIYLDSGMACEADDNQRAAQAQALTTYYTQLDKLISQSGRAAPTAWANSASSAVTSAAARSSSNVNRDPDAIAASGGQFVSKDLLTAAMLLP